MGTGWGVGGDTCGACEDVRWSRRGGVNRSFTVLELDVHRTYRFHGLWPSGEAPSTAAVLLGPLGTLLTSLGLG